MMLEKFFDIIGPLVFPFTVKVYKVILACSGGKSNMIKGLTSESQTVDENTVI